MAPRVTHLALAALATLSGCEVAETTGLFGRTTGGFDGGTRDLGFAASDASLGPASDAGARPDASLPDAGPVARTMESESLFLPGWDQNHVLNPELDPSSTAVLAFDDEFRPAAPLWEFPLERPEAMPVLTSALGVGFNVLMLARAPGGRFSARVWVGSSSFGALPEVSLLGTDPSGAELAIELAPDGRALPLDGVIWRHHEARFIEPLVGAVYLVVLAPGEGPHHLSAPMVAPILDARSPDDRALPAGRRQSDRERDILQRAKRRWMDDMAHPSRPRGSIFSPKHVSPSSAARR